MQVQVQFPSLSSSSRTACLFMEDIYFFEKPEMKKEKKGRNKTLGYDPT